MTAADYTGVSQIILAATGLIGGVGGVVLAFLNYLRSGKIEKAGVGRDQKIDSLSISVDGKLTELTAALTRVAHLEGKAEEAQDERDRRA